MSVCSTLSFNGFLFNVRHVLTGALPSGVKDETLVVFGLRQNPCPRVEESRSRRDSAVDGLIFSCQFLRTTLSI